VCGIAGSIAPAAREEASLKEVAGRMADALRHRGPDDAGLWCDLQAGIVLAHRRLSILDLSSAGHQPMHSADGRYTIVFNGEIYNFSQLRTALEDAGEAPRWRGHSDTEVLLAAINAWGIERALTASVGMFAFGLWDREARSLHLARDRMGEKPLYYGWAGDAFVFGSELKALRAAPRFDTAIDRAALGLFVRTGWIPAPSCIYENARKLLPGTRLEISERAIAQREWPVPKPYWSLRQAAVDGKRTPLDGDEASIANALDERLRESIRGQMVADVPLGAFLSGGVDSSTVVALMQAQSDRPVRTYTIGFRESQYDEAEQARAVARHLGTEHTELYITPGEALAVVPRLPSVYDEPFADASQIPTIFVAELARRHVTVSLSGDGGDELFGGYSRYAWGAALHARLGHLPVFARGAIARGLTVLSPQRWNKLFEAAAPVLPAAARQRLPGDKLHKLASALPYRSPEDLYGRLLRLWPSSIVLDHRGRGDSDDPPTEEILTVAESMMLRDATSYLPDDILVKVDRAAMAVSLETRVPMLDHRVVEFAWQLPLDYKIRGTRGKHILRRVLARYVPPALTERAKMGFSVPLDNWLRGPLRDWAQALLDPERMRSQGFLDAVAVGQRWREHLSGARNHQQSLWAVLMFQSWLDTQHG
jgi:asparagine synthase (glutamine-hydrolysing)